MTSQKLSDDSVCPQCGGPLRERQPHPYPVWIQIFFGASFFAFLLAFDHVRPYRFAIAAWCLIQITLGALLVRGRRRSRIRVLRCIRCNQTVA